MDLQGKTIVVTGASRGLGRQIAVAFLKAGAMVHGTGRDAEAMAQTAAELRQFGGHFELHALELTDEAAAGAFIDGLDEIHVLVNNAGIARAGPFVETDVQTLRQVLEINVVAPFVLMRQAAIKMLRAGSGQIINIASDAALRGIATMAPYVASKHALLGLGRSLTQELRGQGIRLTTYCPGPIDTEILGQGNARALDPEHIARQIVHLASLPPEMEVREILVEPMEMDIP